MAVRIRSKSGKGVGEAAVKTRIVLLKWMRWVAKAIYNIKRC